MMVSEACPGQSQLWPRVPSALDQGLVVPGPCFYTPDPSG